MTFAEITGDLDTEARFDVLLRLAETFSKQPRALWGYSSVEIETARQTMPAITQGRVGTRLPAALLRWYETVGRVPELTASQNRLHAPDKLELRDGVVIIYTENQGCAFWGIRVDDLAHDDPPVVYTESEGWHDEADELSRFALTVGLSELCLSDGGFYCAGMMDDAAIARMHAALRVVPVQTLQWPSPDRDALFLADDTVLILVESEFFFALGVRSDIKIYLDGLVDPGRIDWT
jgi:hypothetical protein